MTLSQHLPLPPTVSPSLPTPPSRFLNTHRSCQEKEFARLPLTWKDLPSPQAGSKTTTWLNPLPCYHEHSHTKVVVTSVETYSTSLIHLMTTLLCLMSHLTTTMPIFLCRPFLTSLPAAFCLPPLQGHLLLSDVCTMIVQRKQVPTPSSSSPTPLHVPQQATPAALIFRESHPRHHLPNTRIFPHLS